MTNIKNKLTLSTFCERRTQQGTNHPPHMEPSFLATEAMLARWEERKFKITAY